MANPRPDGPTTIPLDVDACRRYATGRVGNQFHLYVVTKPQQVVWDGLNPLHVDPVNKAVGSCSLERNKAPQYRLTFKHRNWSTLTAGSDGGEWSFLVFSDGLFVLVPGSGETYRHPDISYRVRVAKIKGGYQKVTDDLKASADFWNDWAKHPVNFRLSKNQRRAVHAINFNEDSDEEISGPDDDDDGTFGSALTVGGSTHTPALRREAPRPNSSFVDQCLDAPEEDLIMVQGTCFNFEEAMNVLGLDLDELAAADFPPPADLSQLPLPLASTVSENVLAIDSVEGFTPSSQGLLDVGILNIDSVDQELMDFVANDPAAMFVGELLDVQVASNPDAILPSPPDAAAVVEPHSSDAGSLPGDIVRRCRALKSIKKTVRFINTMHRQGKNSRLARDLQVFNKAVDQVGEDIKAALCAPEEKGAGKKRKCSGGDEEDGDLPLDPEWTAQLVVAHKRVKIMKQAMLDLAKWEDDSIIAPFLEDLKNASAREERTLADLIDAL